MRCEWFVMFLFRLVTDGRDLWECILGLHWLASGMTGHIPNGQSSLAYKAMDNPCQKELDAHCTDICRFIVWWVSAHLPFFVGTNFSIPVFCVLNWRFWKFLVVVSYCSSVPNKASLCHYSSIKSWPSYVVDCQVVLSWYHSDVFGNPTKHQGGPMALCVVLILVSYRNGHKNTTTQWDVVKLGIWSCLELFPLAFGFHNSLWHLHI